MQSNDKTHVCEVCGSPLHGTICHKCGWTLIVYPASAPQDLINQEKQRLEIMKQRYKEQEHLKHLREVSESKQSAPIALAPSPTNADTPIGVVVIYDRRSDNKQALPIYYGCNTYGTNPTSSSGSDYTFAITLPSRSALFQPEHFCIQVTESGNLEIYSLGNKSITSRGHEFDAKKVVPSDEFSISNDFENYKINILKF